MAETEQGKTKIEKERSTPYPGLNLADALEAAEKLRKAYGASSAYSRETVAEALGYQGLSGTATKKVAALTHFGLLTRDATVYRQSEIANRIFNHLDDEEKRQSIISALKSPALYQKLIAEFDNKALPTALDKVLIRNYNITESAAKSAAKIFIESATFAGVLKHGVLNVSAPSTNNDEAGDAVDQDQSGDQPPAKQPPIGAAVKSDLTVEVPGTGIIVGFPAKYAFELSIGAFAEGIKQLKKDAEALQSTDNETTDADSKD
jgi:hypothetical protein